MKLNLYLDDSGTRHPTRKVGRVPAHGRDWFALGGIIIDESDEVEARKLHAEFLDKWELTKPLHSSEIRSQNKNFVWLRGLPDAEKEKFYEELSQLMSTVSVIGIACVVDRPGYNARYLMEYNNNPWMLCKTAFTIVVERAAKYALTKGALLRVMPERCNKVEDRCLNQYYQDMRTQGLPFDSDTSKKYAPLTNEELKTTLYDFKLKEKTSPMAQLADLYLWPICMGGYDKNNRPYRRLLEEGKLIECSLSEDDWPMLATKYSCFDEIRVTK
ncbi:DUF3800 domain-containing protein [Hwanghaeella sp. 1Z406]|jgi:hypothetical protein|uniref:DUF3800 domain-containing protein n=1 Tax=Hwanghaeella sp. 1Z406 TaxID=3402811 RepID=UPI003B68486A